MTISDQQPGAEPPSSESDPWSGTPSPDPAGEHAPPPRPRRAAPRRTPASGFDQMLEIRWVQIVIAIIWIVFAAAVISVPLGWVIDSRRLAAFIAFVLVGVLGGGVLAYRNYRTIVADEAARDQEKIRAKLMAESTAMTPDQAERCAAAWMRRLGFTDAQTTSPGPDGGVDVVSSLAIAQVKATAKAVGRPVVQQTFGVANAEGRQALVFSMSGYTYEAVRWSDRNGVALFDFDGQCRATPRSVHARNLWSTINWDDPDV